MYDVMPIKDQWEMLFQLISTPIKVFRPYPVILYRLPIKDQTGPLLSIGILYKDWTTLIGVPRNYQNWRTRW